MENGYSFILKCFCWSYILEYWLILARWWRNVGYIELHQNKFVCQNGSCHLKCWNRFGFWNFSLIVYLLLTLNTNFRVIKKNRIPDKAISSLITSFKKRSSSEFHWYEGTARRISMGFFDSSLTLAKENTTAHVRNITKTNEHQKYTARIIVGIGLKSMAF